MLLAPPHSSVLGVPEHTAPLEPLQTAPYQGGCVRQLPPVIPHLSQSAGRKSPLLTVSEVLVCGQLTLSFMLCFTRVDHQSMEHT